MATRFLFLAPDDPTPYGGIRKIYEFVDILVAAGTEAWVVHQRAGFSVEWFTHNTPVTSRQQVTCSADDVLVVPEMMGDSIPSLATGIRKVVLNQNMYQANDRHFTRDDVLGVVVVSEHNRIFCAAAYPGTRLERIRCGVDSQMFAPKPKRRHIAYMPRKRSAEAALVVEALRRRGALRGWTLTPIDGCSQAQAASILSEAAVFLSFSEREGFGLPPLEAMSAGCIVVGFHGLGGQEFFRTDCSLPVPEDDLTTFILRAERVLQQFDDEGFAEMAGEARKQVVQSYSLQQQEADVLRTFHAFAEVPTARKATSQALGPFGRSDDEPTGPGRARIAAWHLRQALRALGARSVP